MSDQRLHESACRECKLAMLCANVDVPVNIVLSQSSLVVAKAEGSREALGKMLPEVYCRERIIETWPPQVACASCHVLG